MEDRIVRLVRKLGPLTGAELRAEPAAEAFACWKAAMLSNRLTVRRVGTRFLRLDRKVDGYARLSPSILREFLTYSVVGLAEDPAGLDRKADEVLAHVRTVSRAKLALATGLVAGERAQVHAEEVALGVLPVPGGAGLHGGQLVADPALLQQRLSGVEQRGASVDEYALLEDLAGHHLLEVVEPCLLAQAVEPLDDVVDLLPGGRVDEVQVLLLIDGFVELPEESFRRGVIDDDDQVEV